MQDWFKTELFRSLFSINPDYTNRDRWLAK